MDHRIESCSYKLRQSKKKNALGKEAKTTGEGKGVKAGAEKSFETMSEAQKDAFGAWMLVTQKRKTKG